MPDDRGLDALIDGAVVADLWGGRGSRLDAEQRLQVVDAVKQRLLGGDAIPVEIALDDTGALRLALRAHIDAVVPAESRAEAGLAVEMALADVVAAATARRIAELEATALIDPLTGLGNRRAAQRAFDAALAYSDRHEGLVAVALADLVGLKRINDEHGHAAGDAALQAFADALRKSMRVADTAFRFGGDEFVVLAPGATSAELAKLFERVRADAPAFTVGLAEAPADGITDADLLAAADARMYAQRRGAAGAAAGPRRPAIIRHVRGRRLTAVALLLALGIGGPVLARTQLADDSNRKGIMAVAPSTSAPRLAEVTDPPRAGTTVGEAGPAADASRLEPTPTTATPTTTQPTTTTPIPGTAIATVDARPVVAPTPTTPTTPTTTTTTTTTTTAPATTDDGEYEATQDDDGPGGGGGGQRGPKPGGGNHRRGGNGKR